MNGIDVDALLDQLADRVADRIMERLSFTQPAPEPDRWMNSAEAAAYLGTTANALHKLTSARTVPFEQDAPGGRLYFKRSDLDAWRRESSTRKR